jgi:hypothetical protein
MKRSTGKRTNCRYYTRKYYLPIKRNEIRILQKQERISEMC